VEHQCVKTDRDSGIVNDANDWAVETLGNAWYLLELFQRVITVSLETLKIVRSLPELDIQPVNVGVDTTRRGSPYYLIEENQ
jgi:hypothetical protein